MGAQLQTFNGWTTYETWLVQATLDNDQALYLEKGLLMSMNARRITPARVERFVRSLFPNGLPGFELPSDYALVDWVELSNDWEAERRFLLGIKSSREL